MPGHDHATLVAFLTDCAARGIVEVVLAWRDEWGQVPDQAAVEYRHLRRAWLLAYDAGTVIRCVLTEAEADRAAPRARLAAAGLHVTERSRNLV